MWNLGVGTPLHRQDLQLVGSQLMVALYHYCNLDGVACDAEEGAARSGAAAALGAA